jgi:hypothetical protein
VANDKKTGVAVVGRPHGKGWMVFYSESGGEVGRREVYLVILILGEDGVRQ